MILLMGFNQMDLFYFLFNGLYKKINYMQIDFGKQVKLIFDAFIEEECLFPNNQTLASETKRKKSAKNVWFIFGDVLYS